MKNIFKVLIVLNIFIVILTNPDKKIHKKISKNDKTIFTITKAKYTKTCFSLSGGFEFELEFTKEGPYNEKIVSFEISLTHIYNKNNIVTDCKLLENDTTFKCVTFDPPEESGKYYPKSPQYETENYIIKEFSLEGQYIQFDLNYVEPLYDYIELTYDYIDGMKANFSIEYVHEIHLIPQTYINNKSLVCQKDDKNKNKGYCFFDIKELPPDESAEQGKKTYIGHIKNACYEPEIQLSITVMKSGDIPKTVLTPYLVEYDKVCKNLDEEDSSFKMLFKRFGLCDFTLEGLEAYLVKEDDESISYLFECAIRNRQFDEFDCISDNITGVIPGNYYVKIKEDTDIDYYTIKKYESKEKCIYTSKRYDEPLVIGIASYDYLKGAVGEIEIEFWEDLIDLPTVKLNQKVVPCRAELDILKCQFTEKELPIDPSSPSHFMEYSGEIINVCGLLEMNFTVNVFKSTMINITNAKFINDNEDDNNSDGICTNLPEKYKFYLEYERIGDYFERQEFSIYLKNKKNQTQKVAAKCIISNEYLINCSTVDKPDKQYEDGEYLVVVDETQRIYYKINSFKSENYLTFNKNYSHPARKVFIEKHDYFNSKIGDFVLSFESNLIEKPKIIFEDNSGISTSFPLKNCDIEDEKYLFCSFSSQEFPTNPYFHITEMTYEGYLINACGFNESKIFVTVYRSKDITTNIVVDSLAKKEGYCFNPKDNIEFKLAFDRQGIYENEIIIKNKIKLINENDDSIYLNTSCKNDINDNNFTCTLLLNNNEIIEGKYYPYLDKDYADGFVTIKKFNLKNDEGKVINFNNEHIQPLSLFEKDNEILIYHDYKDNEIGKIRILFKNVFVFKNFIPYIMINHNKLECDAFLNILTCSFNQRQLPSHPLDGKKERTYTGYLMDVCGYKEKKVDVIVKKSFTPEKIKVFINENAEFSMENSTYKKYFEFKLLMTKNEDNENEIKIDNVYLVNKNDNKYKIKTKCVYLNNKRYFICKSLNDKIDMLGKYFVEMNEKYVDDKVIVYPFKSVNYAKFIGSENKNTEINTNSFYMCSCPCACPAY